MQQAAGNSANDRLARLPSLQRRVVRKIVLPMALLVTAFIVGLMLWRAEIGEELERDEVHDLALEQAFGFEQLLASASRPTVSNAWLVERLPGLGHGQYWSWFRDLLIDRPLLSGIGVAFPPPGPGSQRSLLYTRRAADGNFHQVYASEDESAAPVAGPFDGSHRRFGPIARERRPMWSRPWRDRSTGDAWTVTYSAPFDIAADGALDGVAFCDLPIEALHRELERTGVFRNGQVLLIDREGRYVYHPDTRLIGQPVAAWTALGEEAQALTAPLPDGEPVPVLHEHWPDQGKRWVTRLPIRETGWTLVSLHEDDSLILELSGNDIYNGLAMLLMLIVLFLLALKMTRRLTDTVGGMSVAAESVARGDWRIDLPETGTRELASLSHSLNQMARQLGERDAQLQAQRRELELFNQLLEERVAQRTAEATAARAEAERANVAKSRFLANISHELRTPMNAIIGFVVLSEDIAEGEYVARSRDYFRKIGQAGKTLRKLIDELLDLSKMEADGLKLEAQPFQLAGVIDRVLSISGEAARQKGLKLKISNEPGVPRHLIGDALRLQQVLTNLISNAIKFTQQGEVLLSVRAAAAVPPQGYVRLVFAVRDSGMGIEPEVLPKLFQAFVQADPSTTRRFGGTGLGLAICRELVELMGGQIQVESELGRGSCFHFEVEFGQPAGADEASGTTSRLPEPPLKLSGRHVLLAEDHEINREIASELLQRAGIRVTIASNGAEAIRALHESDHDLVLMDLQMPVMDGLTAARLIRAEPRWNTLPLIALTANAMIEDQQACLAAGMDAHLAKPLDASALYALLDRYLA